MIVGLNNKKEPQTMKQLSKDVGIVYAHLTTVLRQFQKEGIIQRHQGKNIINISLTKKGEKIAFHLRELEKVIEGESDNNIMEKEDKNNNNKEGE